MDPTRKVCVVIPTYNERENIRAVVEALEQTNLSGLSVLFVDDASPDGTGEAVRSVAESRPWVRLLERGKKEGIGSAYRDGFGVALADPGVSVLVEMDADLQHPASTVGLLTKAISEGAEVAVGSRYVPGGGISGWSRIRRATSRGANAYSRLVLGLKVKDATSGLRAYTREAASAVASARLPATGYEFQPAALHLLENRFRIVEVPYVFTERSVGRSKLRLRDMARFFFTLAWIGLSGRPRPLSKTEIRARSPEKSS